MELITDASRGDWLLARAGTFATVGGAAGTGFEAYARILHPVSADREDRSIVDEWGGHPDVESAVWPWAEVATRTGKTMHPLVQWRSLTGRADESDQVLEDGWRVQAPDEGWFEPTLLAALTEHLAEATSTPDGLVGAIWDGWGYLSGGSTLAVGWQGPDEPTAEEIESMRRYVVEQQAVHDEEQTAIRVALAVERFAWPHRECFLLSMTLQQLADPTWLDHARIGTAVDLAHTPQMLWPEDRAWVLASEIDWDSTIVGGSRALVDAVLDDDRFEAFPVDEDSDLTWSGDLVNG
ncbi:hypothetical protein [Curtobacterium sp. VKM Ac-1393]|uniref:hypothetical protein n=1 Tax=Curtobacterium sp. VKM Ac-1393 TaxID=2783814 RepID=UPI00188CB8C6|nr:hypothetical protein [Curtobacterium sp. VKM Ac-1393]MBF4609590.1 hypothetical protein [Curtobacterium sp. VKM Ac-1393]